MNKNTNLKKVKEEKPKKNLLSIGYWFVIGIMAIASIGIVVSLVRFFTTVYLRLSSL